MSITKGIIHNGIANITQRAIRILDQLILVPFFSQHGERNIMENG